MKGVLLMRVAPGTKMIAAVLIWLSLLLSGCTQDTVVFDYDTASENRADLLSAFGPAAMIGDAELSRTTITKKIPKRRIFENPIHICVGTSST